MSKIFDRNAKTIISLVVILSLTIIAIPILLFIRNRRSSPTKSSNSPVIPSSQNLPVQDSEVRVEVENNAFCQDILPNITSLDDPNTVKLLQEKLKLCDFFWLLPESCYSCKSISNDILVKIRQEAKEILQEGDLFCQESSYQLGQGDPDADPPVIKYKQIVDEPPVKGIYRVRSLYAQLMIARLFQAIKSYMLASDEDRVKKYSLIRQELAAWRAASGMPHLGCPHRLTARIYDLDSAIRYILKRDDGWLSKVEKQTFIERETRRFNLKANQTYLDLVKSCVDSDQGSQDCYKLGKDVYRFLKIQDHSELGGVGDYLRNHVSTKPSNITPLEWFSGNCGIQAAVQCLAPVQEELDFLYVTIPKLKSQNHFYTDVYNSLMDTLDVINKRKPAPQDPYPFPELYKALTTKSANEEFNEFYNDSKGGFGSDLLKRFINPFATINRLYDSPFLIWRYFISYNSDDKGEEQIFFWADFDLEDVDQGIYQALLLYKIRPLENLFSSPVPDRYIFFSGPKLLFITQLYKPPVSNSIPQIWTISVNAGDRKGEDIVTMKYILRSALFFPGGHYSSMLHYGGVHSKDEWFWCDLSTCTPGGSFDFPQGVRPDGRNEVSGLIYERID